MAKYKKKRKEKKRIKKWNKKRKSVKSSYKNKGRTTMMYIPSTGGNNVVAVRAKVGFYKTNADIDSVISASPDGSVEFCTPVANLSCLPMSMADPLGLSGAGAYPKAAALALWYDEVNFKSVWASIQCTTSDIGVMSAFSYWHTGSGAQTARHAVTDSKGKMVTIPTIEFKRFPQHGGISTSTRTITIFRKIDISRLYRKGNSNPKDNVGSFTAAAANLAALHFGIIRTDGIVAEAKVQAFQVRVGGTAILTRRDEIVNP